MVVPVVDVAVVVMAVVVMAVMAVTVMTASTLPSRYIIRGGKRTNENRCDGHGSSEDRTHFSISFGVSEPIALN
jgi:hypothetical protein